MLNPRNRSWITKVRASSRSLSKIRRIYCGCAGFGHIFRSFSLNSHYYSPQTIETSDSNQHPLVTIANLGPAPRRTWQNKKSLFTTEVTTTFFISPCTPISYTSFLRPTAVARLKNSATGFFGCLNPSAGQVRRWAVKKWKAQENPRQGKRVKKASRNLSEISDRREDVRV